MNGQLAVLYQGEQVGGIYDWNIDIRFEHLVVNKSRQYTSHKLIAALSYWLIKVPHGNEFDAEFYQVIQNNLVLMDAGKVSIDLPDRKTLNRRLYAPLEIGWLGVE